ncbi:MAG: T9SS type A sorting domain-containing protein [bacterium]
MIDTNKRLILLVFAIGLTFHQRAEAQFEIPKRVLGSGGETASDSRFRIVGTVGQPVIGAVSNSANIHQAGFWYDAIELVTSVDQVPSETIPTEFQLAQNYPNPFNPTTTIEFALPGPSQVTLELFDLLGRKVALLVDEALPPGEFKVLFDASGLASGVYLYRLRAEGFVRTRKLTLLK